MITEIQKLVVKFQSKFKDRKERIDFASDFFGYEVKSFSELNQEETQKLVSFLEGKTNFPRYEHYAKFNQDNRQHKFILSLAHQLGWVSEENPRLVDLNRLGGWIQSKCSPVQKPLKEMGVKECTKIINTIQIILTKKQLEE